MHNWGTTDVITKKEQNRFFAAIQNQNYFSSLKNFPVKGFLLPDFFYYRKSGSVNV